MPRTNHRFRIDLPPDWEDRSIYTFWGPEEKGVQHQLLLVIDQEAEGTDVEEYAQERIENLKASLEGIHVLKSARGELDGGEPMYEFVYKWMSSDDKPMFGRQIYVSAKGGVYTFSGTFSKQTMKTRGAEMLAMIKSFALEKDGAA